MLASEIYGTAPVFVPAVQPDTAMSSTSALSGTSGVRRLVDPGNPLFWAGVLILVTVGAAGAAGAVKLGPAQVGAKLGKAG
jgi:hypothetical protein